MTGSCKISLRFPRSTFSNFEAVLFVVGKYWNGKDCRNRLCCLRYESTEMGKTAGTEVEEQGEPFV
jgi:hypothetical protein